MYFGGRMATRQWQIPLRPFVSLNISPLTLGSRTKKSAKKFEIFTGPKERCKMKDVTFRSDLLPLQNRTFFTDNFFVNTLK